MHATDDASAPFGGVDDEDAEQDANMLSQVLHNLLRWCATLILGKKGKKEEEDHGWLK